LKWRHAFLTEEPIPGAPILGPRWFEFLVIFAIAFLARLFLFN
jgi:hypothetical protein